MTTRDQLNDRLAELDRQRAEIEEEIQTLQAGEVEPRAEAVAERRATGAG